MCLLCVALKLCRDVEMLITRAVVVGYAGELVSSTDLHPRTAAQVIWHDGSVCDSGTYRVQHAMSRFMTIMACVVKVQSARLLEIVWVGIKP